MSVRNYEEYRKQVLDSLGEDYTVEDLRNFERWRLKVLEGLANIGIDPEVIGENVDAWLEAHPEATTTVQDGTITDAKLASSGVKSELADIRVGADGTTYPSAGDAVRGQFSDIENTLFKKSQNFKEFDLTNTSKFTVDTKANFNASVSGWTGGKYAGKLDPLTDFYTYNFVPSTDITVACDGAENAYFALLLVKNPEADDWQAIQDGYYIIGDTTRYRKSENNLPTAENPLIIPAGTRVCVTVKKNETAKIFIKTVTRSAIKSEALGAEANYISVEMHDGYFYYYYPTKSGKFIRSKFMHFVDASSNADGWIQRTVDLVTHNRQTVIMPIVVDGEWEMAVKIKDTPDFIGCMNHGSEISTIVNIYFDGIKKAIIDGENLICKEIKVCQKSTMYNPADETTVVGYHYKTHIITVNGIEIRQRIEWTTDQVLDMSYACMLPACRGNDYKLTAQVTDRAYDEKTYTEYDCSTTTMDHYLTALTDKGNAFNLYGSTSGIALRAECNIKDKPASAFTFLSNSVYYNKVYFAHNGADYPVHNGDVWEWVSKYQIKYTEL